MILLALMLSSAAIAETGSRIVNAVRKDHELSRFDLEDLKDEAFARQTAVIFTILSLTNEKHIHQFGGQTDNETMLLKDGHTELVVRFSKDEFGEKIEGTGVIVSDCANMASYNYYNPYERPLSHFTADIFPWMKLGNCKNDPTSPEQRVEAYLLDFSEAVNSMLFELEEYYLPDQFDFGQPGQSEAVALFLKALSLGGYDTERLGNISVENPLSPTEFLAALDTGFKKLMLVPNKKLR